MYHQALFDMDGTITYAFVYPDYTNDWNRLKS